MNPYFLLITLFPLLQICFAVIVKSFNPKNVFLQAQFIGLARSVHRPQRVVMRCGNLPFKEKPAGKHKQRKHPLKVVSQGRLLKFSPKRRVYSKQSE